MKNVKLKKECNLNFIFSIKDKSAIKHQPKRNPKSADWYFKLPITDRKGRTSEELELEGGNDVKYRAN